MGVQNSLVQTVLKLTVPGVPDIYQGAELWDLSMMDPDNRRPVDYAGRVRMLAELTEGRPECAAALLEQWRDGRIKLSVIAKILAFRRDHAELFTAGSYEPLSAEGGKQDHVCALVRRNDDEAVVVAAARFPAALEAAPDWGGTLIPLPEALQRIAWRDILTGAEMGCSGGGLPAQRVFQYLPVAVLAARAG